MKDYKEFKKFLKTLDKEKKSTLLLHSCCAVCSPHILNMLKEYFDITIYFLNDNIYPKEEYDKRLNSLKYFINQFDSKLKILEESYNPLRFDEAVKGHESNGEKSSRCFNCYKYRLELTRIKAEELNFDYFTTTLSISPYKVSSWINEIGNNLETMKNTKFLYSDFKKDNGFLKSNEFVKRYNLYKQKYCGCIYSLNESIKRRDTNANSNKKN